MNNKLSEIEIWETTPFTVALRKTKYLGISVTKEVKNLYIENYGTLKKQIEEDIRKWKISSVFEYAKLI